MTAPTLCVVAVSAGVSFKLNMAFRSILTGNLHISPLLPSTVSCRKKQHKGEILTCQMKINIDQVKNILYHFYPLDILQILCVACFLICFFPVWWFLLSAHLPPLDCSCHSAERGVVLRYLCCRNEKKRGGKKEKKSGPVLVWAVQVDTSSYFPGICCTVVCSRVGPAVVFKTRRRR